MTKEDIEFANSFIRWEKELLEDDDEFLEYAESISDSTNTVGTLRDLGLRQEDLED